MTVSDNKAGTQLVSPKDLDPMVRKIYMRVPEPSLRDNRGDVDRVLDRVKKQEGLSSPSVSIPMAGRISETLHASGFSVTLTIAQTGRFWEVLDVEEGDQCHSNFGVAVDLGSTNMVFYLLDLHQGIMIDQVADENPQVQHGEDILSRIHHCKEPQGLKELQEMLTHSFRRNISALLRKQSVDAGHLYALAVAGNTTMIHLLLGLSPQRICREPYIPVVNRPDIFQARNLGLDTNENALCYLLPNVGSYVGGDVLAGILVSGMHLSEDSSVLVDVGTNAEIVLGNRDWLMVAAGAAGPALEGGVVQCGMRATHGAIERVSVDRKTFVPTCSTIGGGRPAGICGSGLIDMMAELFLAGVIDERGKIVVQSDHVVEWDDHVKAFLLASAQESRTGEQIVLTELDINNLLRTKGAMYTALAVITRKAGISFQELKHFYVAGTFGAFIDPQMAVTIGMVPDIPLERYKPLFNSAGTGACLCLLSNQKRQELEDIRDRITYMELNVDGDFMNLLNAAMFLPHTDITQFPSVSRAK